MKFLYIFFVLFLLLVLQGGLIGNLGFGQAGSLVLLYVVVSVILSDFNESFFTVMVAGLMLDLVSGTRVGTMMIAILSVFGFTYFFINKLVTREPNRVILLACIALDTILFALMVVAVNKFFSFAGLDTLIDWRFALNKKLFTDLVINIIFTYPIFMLYLRSERLQKRFAKYI